MYHWFDCRRISTENNYSNFPGIHEIFIFLEYNFFGAINKLCGYNL